MENQELDSTQQLAFFSPEVLEKFPGLGNRKPWPIIPMHERLQAAERLRERLGSVPFYAKKAAAAEQEGDEIAYWLSLQGSQMTAHRP